MIELIPEKYDIYTSIAVVIFLEVDEMDREKDMI